MKWANSLAPTHTDSNPIFRNSSQGQIIPHKNIHLLGQMQEVIFLRMCKSVELAPQNALMGMGLTAADTLKL